MRYLFIFICFSCLKCKVDRPVISYQTENIVIMIMDGPRWTETFGEPTMQYIPGIKSLLSSGTYLADFRNEGGTSTTSGHVAITTGVYQAINNNGQELPDHPGFFQRWIKDYKKDNSKAWIVSSKDKLAVLKNCKDDTWENLYMPMTDCGINGLGTGHRMDSTTFRKAKEIMTQYHPTITWISFKEPDVAGHSNNWPNYLQGIRNVDAYFTSIWSLIQADPVYRDKTTLLITNDHGRHLDNVADGFVSHGDNCEGCRQIMLFAIGPDTPKGKVITGRYDQTDLHLSIIRLMGIDDAVGGGKMIEGLFE